MIGKVARRALSWADSRLGLMSLIAKYHTAAIRIAEQPPRALVAETAYHLLALKLDAELALPEFSASETSAFLGATVFGC